MHMSEDVTSRVITGSRNEFASKAQVIGGEAAKIQKGVRDGSSGGSVGRVEINDLHDSAREVLEKFTNEKDYSRLSEKSTRESIKRWGVPKSETEFKQNLQKWNESMDVWWSKLPSSQRTDMESVLKQFGVKPVPSEAGGLTRVDWMQVRDVFYGDGKPDIRKFVEGLKKMPGVEDKLKSAKALAGIFGKEVSEDIFGAGGENMKEWARHNQERKDWAEKAYKEGRISERQKNKFQDHVDRQQGNHDRIFTFNGLKFEGFTSSQETQVKEALKMLPPELMAHIKAIRIMPDDEYGAMRYFPHRKYKDGVVEIKGESFGYDKDTFQRKVLHEIGGHGMRDMVHALDPELHREMMSLWNEAVKAHPGLVTKDTYSRDIIRGKRYADHPRNEGLILASVDEFWSDRMAEYWYAKAADARGSSHRVSSNRDENNPFTESEETEVRRVCQKSEEIWRKVIAKKGIAIEAQEKSTGLDKNENGRVDLSYVYDRINAKGYYEGSIPDGVIPAIEGKAYFDLPVIIDRINDGILQEMIQNARELKAIPEEQRCMALLQLVDSYTTASEDTGDASTWDKVRDFQEGRLRNGNGNKAEPVMLGQYTKKGDAGGGACNMRALFIQILGNEAGLNPRLLMGSLKKRRHREGSRGDGSHMWNDGIVGGKKIVLESYRAAQRPSRYESYAAFHEPKQENDSEVRAWYYNSKGKLVYSV